MITVRGQSDGKDGRIHTDSATKLITVLLYLNPGWEAAAGRLRLLRGADDLDDYAAEVAAAGRHDGRVPPQRRVVSRPSPAPRRASRAAAELGDRHERWCGASSAGIGWSARLKALNPFG